MVEPPDGAELPVLFFTEVPRTRSRRTACTSTSKPARSSKPRWSVWRGWGRRSAIGPRATADVVRDARPGGQRVLRDAPGRRRRLRDPRVRRDAAGRDRPARPRLSAPLARPLARAPPGPPDGSLDAIKRGDAGVLYASGLGPTDTAVADTAAAPRTSLIRAMANVQVWVNGIAQNTFFAGLTPGQFGLYQANFILGQDTPVLDNDRNEVWLTVNGAESAHVKISVER